MAEAAADAATLAASTPPVLKPWILPSGNAIVRGKAGQHGRIRLTAAPEGLKPETIVGRAERED